MYRNFLKRLFDLVLSIVAVVLLLPLMLALTVIGTFKMKGNPFFVQKRPGRNEKIFSLLKFRSMTNERGPDGDLLPDKQRLRPYGTFLRASSLDELPELFNIIKGDMALVGPRPLLVQYLPLYNEEQRHRHDVRPGLTGYAQVHGRNAVSWQEKFSMDVWYSRNVSFSLDTKILISTVVSVLRREGITSDSSATMEPFTGNDD